ncbi:phlebovirus glycoprotein g2 domain-containing protein [Ditylenchus destructor]|uniref:Envelopment polyprotein n=1 Tax=Ditylenchus destructor TaxID=166010 RepID=A0AAD4N894_9BILA|nr:phlebovirus glycoprotein g2 domain-containing protein [Ditylenchus destructor]
MSAPFKREIEPLFTQLLNLKKQAVKLIARQPLGPEEVYAAPEQQEGDQEERLTYQEYQISAETFLQRIQGVISHVKEVNKEWKAFIHSRTPAELSKANDDYFNFLIADGDDQIHFLTLMEEGQQAIASVEQSLTVLHINQAQIRQAQNQPAVQEQNVPQQPPVELPAEQPEPRKQTQAAAHEAQNAAQQLVAANLLAQPHIQDAQPQATAPPFEADFALLKRRFGNRQAISEMLQSELIALPKATDAIQSLRTLSESIERICRQMHSMRLSDEHPIMATTIKSKLPYSVMTKLVERERAEGGNWNTAKLRQGIQEIIAVREEVQRSTGMARSAPPTNSHKDTPRSSRHKNDGHHQEITRSFPVTSNDKKKPPQKRPKIQPNIKSRTPGSKCFLCGKATEDNASYDSIVATSVSTQPSEVLLMAKETKISSTENPKKATQGLIFFDTGSQTSFIRIEVAKQLRLRKLEESELEVHGFSQQPIRFQSPKYAVRIHLQEGRFIDLVLNGTAKISSSFTTTTVTGVKNHPILGKVANVLSKQRNEPDLLIGMGDFWQFLQRVEEMSKDLYMVYTTIGPMLCGRTHLPSVNSQRTISNVAIGPSNVEDMPHTNDVKDFWSLEAIGVHDNPEDNDNEKAMELFRKSVHRIKGRYCVRWPWKDDSPELPSNFEMCYSRLGAALQKLQASPELLQEYDKVLKDQLEKGIIEPAKIKAGAEIARNTYVDNILMSANSTNEAKAKIVESKHIFAEAKMNLREYISNSPEVNESVPAEDRLGKAHAKVLGIPWNPDTDELSIPFIPKEVSAQRGYSKRTILQDLASTFDPLGLAAPAVLPGKIFFQTLWISSTEDKTKFVANRLKEIRKYTNCAYRYVPTDENPSDLSTRGCSPAELQVHSQWWHGPPWLTRPEDEWPQILQVEPPTEPESEVIASVATPVMITSSAQLLEFKRFSKWQKLVRTTAYTLRFIRKCANNISLKMDLNLPSSGSLAPEELEAANHALLLNHQKNLEISPEKASNWQLIEGPDGPTPEDGEDWVPRLSTRDKVLNAWERTTAYLQLFWDLWKESYLTLLRERSQRDHKGPHLQNRRAPQLGEIVLIEDDLQPRNVWRLGKIVELPTSGPIRTAKVLTANKNVLTRPISRLYSLEIPLSEESNDTQPEEVAPESISVEQNPTPKTATETKHQYNLRDRAKIKPPARTLLVTLALLCLTSITARPFKDCASCDFSCTPDGVRLQTPTFIKKAEICCKNYDCKEVHRLNDFSIELPQSLRANTHFCRAQVWGTRKYYKMEIECPAIDICQLTDCYFCIQQLRNPECRPNFSAILTGTGLMAILLAICLVLKIIKKITSYLFNCGKCVICTGSLFYRCCQKEDEKSKTRLDTSSESETLLSSRKKPKMDYRPFRILPFSLPGGRVIRLITILIMVSLCPPQTQQCADIISFSAKEEKCEILRNETRCTINDATELTLLPAGQEVCLFLKDAKGNPMGTLKLKLDHISVNCIPRTEAVTRSYAMKVEPRHHCPTVGSCSGDYCTNVNTETDIPELSEYYHYPGHSYCHDSCTLWDCTPSCGLPTTSCLFYRTYAYPLTDTVYEVFTCPDWRYGIKIELQLEVNQQVETTELTLVEGLVTHWKNISISPLIVAQPPAPVFGRHFITDGTNVAMVTSFASDLHCANASAAKEFKCTIRQEACTDCVDVGQIIHCKCKDVPIEDLMENPELRLPLMVGRYEVKNSAKDVFVESHHNPIRLFTKVESLRVVAATDGSTCTIRPINLTGCYRCDTGGELAFECSTDFGNALATVTCAENLIFTQACNTNLSQYSTVLHFDSPDVDTNCTVECPGSNTEFRLKGELRYIPISDQVGYEEISKKDYNPSNPTCILCDVDIPQLFDFIDTWSIIVYIIAAFVVSGLILTCIIRWNPAFRLWKLSYRLIASHAMIFILLRSDQSVASLTSFNHSAAALTFFGESNANIPISQSANTSLMIDHLSYYISSEKEKKNHSYLGSGIFESSMNTSTLIHVLLEKTEMTGTTALRSHLRCIGTIDRAQLVSWLLDNYLLETTHLRVNRRVHICDLTSLDASIIKPFGRPRYSVADHFEENCRALEHPDLQCVVENSGYNGNGLPIKKYFPLEVIKVTSKNHNQSYRPVRGNTSNYNVTPYQLQSPPPYSQAPTVPETHSGPATPNTPQAPTVPNRRIELPSPPSYAPPAPTEPETENDNSSVNSLDTDTQFILSSAVSSYIAEEAIQFTHAQLDFGRKQDGAFKVTVTLAVGIEGLQDQRNRRSVLEEARAQLATAALNLYTPNPQTSLKRTTMRCRDRARKVRNHVQGTLISMAARMEILYQCTGTEFKFSISETRTLPATRCTDTNCIAHGQPSTENSRNNATRFVPMPRVTTRNPRRLTGSLTNRLGILSLLMVGIIPLVSAQSYAPTKGPDLLSTLIAVLTIGMCTSSVNPTLRAIHNFYTRPGPICQNCHEPGHFALDCEDMRYIRLSGHGNTIWDQRCIATSRLDRLSTCKRKNAKTNQWPKKRSAAMSQLKIPISRAMTHLEIEMYKERRINQNSPLTTTHLHLQRMAEPSNEDIMATCNSLADEYVEQIVAEAKRPATNRGAKGRPKQGPAVQPGPLVKTAVKRVTIRPKPQAQPAQQAVEPQSAPIQARQVTTAQEAPTRKATNPKPPVAPRKIAPQPAKRPRSPTPELDYEPEEEEQYYEEGELAEPEEIPSPPRRKILKGVVSRKQDSPRKERSPTQRPHQRGRSTKRESSTPPRRHRARSTQREKSPRRHERARSKSESPPRRDKRARSKSESPPRRDHRARSMAPNPSSKNDSRPRKDALRHNVHASREEHLSSRQQPADGIWVTGRDGRTLCRFAETILEIFGKKP